MKEIEGDRSNATDKKEYERERESERHTHTLALNYGYGFRINKDMNFMNFNCVNQSR